MSRSFAVDVHDAFADPKEAKHEYNVALMDTLEDTEKYDCVIGAVAHDMYTSFTVNDLEKLAKKRMV